MAKRKKNPSGKTLLLVGGLAAAALYLHNKAKPKGTPNMISPADMPYEGGPSSTSGSGGKR